MIIYQWKFKVMISQSKFHRYQTIPIDNINSNEGLKIGDIYSDS